MVAAMPDDSEEIFRVLSDAWVKAMDKEDYHDATATGIAIYLIMRQRQAEKLALHALAFIHPAISSLLMIDGGTAPGRCSFCRRSDLHLRMGTGDGLICDPCVRLFAKLVGSEDQ